MEDPETWRMGPKIQIDWGVIRPKVRKGELKSPCETAKTSNWRKGSDQGELKRDPTDCWSK